MSGIYIHIPFCRKRCNYCDFYSSTNLFLKQDYINSIIKEIELQQNFLPDKKIETVYFGGGTPSLLSVDHIVRILETIHKTFTLTNSPEITLEANPDDSCGISAGTLLLSMSCGETGVFCGPATDYRQRTVAKSRTWRPIPYPPHVPERIRS